MPKFSIIIPVYKVELYLKQCIDSVLCQTFTDFELILVDDGSPDNCPQICDKYASRDKRIFVIHKANGGLSSARNAGLDVAKGEYVLFLDSDDFWLDKNDLKELSIRINTKQEDVVIFPCDIYFEDGRIERSRGDYDFSVFDSNDKSSIIEYLVFKNQIPGAAWDMAVKRDLIELLKIRFPLGVTAEDYIWTITLLVECNSIGAVNCDWYAYIKRQESITASSKLSGIKGITLSLRHALSCGYHEKYPILMTYFKRIEMISIMSYFSLPQKDKLEAKNMILSCDSVLPLYLRITIHIIGVNCFSRMVQIMYKIIR